MKQFKIITILLMLVFSISLTGCQEQNSAKETKDPFVGTWQAQADDIYNSIEEIVITKEKDTYFVRAYEWRYYSNYGINDNGKFDKDSNGKLINTLTLTKKSMVSKTNAQIKGSSLIVPLQLGQITIEATDGKIRTKGISQSKETLYEKTNKESFNKLLDAHLKTYTKLEVDKHSTAKIDNSILNNKN